MFDWPVVVLTAAVCVLYIGLMLLNPFEIYANIKKTLHEGECICLFEGIGGFCCIFCPVLNLLYFDWDWQVRNNSLFTNQSNPLNKFLDAVGNGLAWFFSLPILCPKKKD